jgi:hypothetical protein
LSEEARLWNTKEYTFGICARAWPKPTIATFSGLSIYRPFSGWSLHGVVICPAGTENNGNAYVIHARAGGHVGSDQLGRGGVLINNLTGALDGVTLLDETIVPEDRDTDVVGLQVQTRSTNTGRELYHLLGYRKVSVRGVAPEWVTTEHTLHVPETPDMADTVTDTYRTRLGRLDAGHGIERRTQGASHFLDVSANGGARNARLDFLSLYADAMAWRGDAIA